jgi:hypothetical protein
MLNLGIFTRSQWIFSAIVFSLSFYSPIIFSDIDKAAIDRKTLDKTVLEKVKEQIKNQTNEKTKTLKPETSQLVQALLQGQTSHSGHPNNPPSSFTYQGKPIDALCVGKMVTGENGSETINLAECNLHTDYKMVKLNPVLLKKGYIGFDYSHKVNEDYTEQGYNYYKYIGAYKDLPILFAIQNSGGSGLFSSLLLVKQEKDSLKLIEQLALGDRCNGGIDETVIFKNNKLIYKTHITPFDILELSGEKPKSIQAYEDLAACASCCGGVAVFEYDFEKWEKASQASESQTLKSPLKPQLVSVTFGVPNAVIQGQYQACFDKLVNENQQKQQGKLMTLNRDELKVFSRQFISTCIKEKEKQGT